MAFDPIYEQVKLDYQKRLCTSQAVVEARLQPEGQLQIAKVLSIATDCTVKESEVFASEARYSGKVNFKIIYVDTTGANQSMNYDAEFTDKIVCDKIKAGMSMHLVSSILDTDIVSVENTQIKLACVVEVSLDAVCSEEVNALVSGGESVYTQSDNIEYSSLVARQNQSFEVSDVLQGVDCSRVLLVEPKIVTNERTAMIDSVMVGGEVICFITVLTVDGMIASHMVATPFSCELSMSDVRDEHYVTAMSKILSCSAVMLGDDSELVDISLEYEIECCSSVFCDDATEVVVDCFSIENELLVTAESLEVYKNKLNTTICERVEGSVTLDINMPIVDNILAVTGSKLNVASIVCGDGYVTYEGIVSANIIYYCAEQDVKSSVAVELPFSITNDCDVDEDDVVTAFGCVKSINTKIRRGNEIDIKTEICLEIFVSCNDSKYVITELKEGSERILPTSAFSIHIARENEALWDVAKALGSTPEVILLQNPMIELPFMGGERVVAYRHLRDKS